ncbi:hypothetical protein [Budvicia aquatica]|uniref:Type 1 fimbrial protein n=1 Tax=Budvicia aquatica TaxID=82979 RepID=A0A2C6CXN5_9GAMM|nr:hypothetical protein [Budvicia aquatica]MBP9643713.1 hypothetical protein [Budvicia sp.]PHI31449.1 hypothetical protein CRN84_19940 [Budvicia aquatica]GKX50959.1 hypothetical protein SOASR029_12680 [Budvicia aquatica]
MKDIVKTSVKGLFLLITGIVSLSVLNVWASSSAQITFVGRVVEEPCDFSSNNRVVTLTCSHNNRQPLVTQVPINQATEQPQQLGNGNMVSFNWVDKSRKLGIATITYN